MKPLIVMSMLHEHARLNSAARMFHGRPVLRWTVERAGATGFGVVVVCWADQVEAVTAAVGGAVAVDYGDRRPLPKMEAVAVGRRWADGWRSPLMQSAAFDRGFDGPAVLVALGRVPAAGVMLVDPASALIDPELLTGLAGRAGENVERDFFFLPVPPGLSAAILTAGAVRELGGWHPGRSLHYHPDRYGGDPISSPSCGAAPTAVVRSMLRFTLDDAAQVALAERAVPDAGRVPSAAGLVAAFDAALLEGVAGLPRDVRLDISARRNTKPVFLPAAGAGAEVSLVEILPILDSLRDPGHEGVGFTSSTRVMLGGMGDPLLHSECLGVISAAVERGIAVSVETDFVGVSEELPGRLAEVGLDILMVNLPAASAGVYAAAMGVDAHEEVLRNLQRFLNARGGRLVPLLIPVFTKLGAGAPGGGNCSEMEPWYDHYLRQLGHAVIDGPSTFAGAVAELAVAEMSPTTRRPCRRLGSRMTLLPDLSMPACELTTGPAFPGASARTTPLRQLWTEGLAPLRLAHATNGGGSHSLPAACTQCTDWHRP